MFPLHYLPARLIFPGDVAASNRVYLAARPSSVGRPIATAVKIYVMAGIDTIAPPSLPR